MKPNSIAIVGAAETTRMGRIPDMSVIGLHADAALNTLADASLAARDIDGVATAGENPTSIAHYLGIVPTWVDGTSVGGCSFMLHVRHAAAAINEGLCKTVLITHGESGRSRVGAGGRFGGGGGSSLAGQFEGPYGPVGPTTMFTIPALRYMKTNGVTEEDLATVAVIQREWAALNPRASFRDPITVEDVLASDMIAWPFRKLMCCLVTDGGGALILTSAERAKDFPQKPVYILGTGESVETPMVSQMADFTSSRAFRVAGAKAFAEAGLTQGDIRPPDDLRRLRPPADLWPGGSRLLRQGRGRRLHPRAEHGDRRQAATEHQRRRALLHALGDVRHVRPAGERAADARNRAGAGSRGQDLAQPWRWRHVRRLRRGDLFQRGAMIRLYEHPLSPYAQKIKIALREKSLEFEVAAPDGLGAGSVAGTFARANPRAEVPVLIDGETAIFDSTIILEYLEDRFPSPPLLPALAADRARVRMIEEVMDTHYEPINWAMAEINWFGRATGPLAQELKATAARQTAGFYSWLTGHLGARPWFNGEAFGWGDLSVAPFVAASAGLGNPPAAGSPLANWLGRVLDRSSVGDTLAEAAAFNFGDTDLAGLLAQGLFKREYRDHRLEWMMKSGGVEIVLDGLKAANIRFTPDFG